MIVKTLDGKLYKLVFKRKSRSTASGLHKEAIETIKENFPAINIVEEVKIKIKRGCVPLYIDIYLPAFNLAIEVHGKQHYEYIQHFHSNGIRDFYKQQNNDQQKLDWCLLNEIPLLILKYDERNNWARQIRQTIRSNVGPISQGPET